MSFGIEQGKEILDDQLKFNNLLSLSLQIEGGSYATIDTKALPFVLQVRCCCSFFSLMNLFLFSWPGTIRVPGVCQYAHKLAFLAAQSLHSQPHESLADKLFYL